MSKAIASYQCPISGMFVTQRLINGSIEEFVGDTADQAEQFASENASSWRNTPAGIQEELDEIQQVLEGNPV